MAPCCPSSWTRLPSGPLVPVVLLNLDVTPRRVPTSEPVLGPGRWEAGPPARLLLGRRGCALGTPRAASLRRCRSRLGSGLLAAQPPCSCSARGPRLSGRVGEPDARAASPQNLPVDVFSVFLLVSSFRPVGRLRWRGGGTPSPVLDAVLASLGHPVSLCPWEAGVPLCVRRCERALCPWASHPVTLML